MATGYDEPQVTATMTYDDFWVQRTANYNEDETLHERTPYKDSQVIRTTKL